MVKGMQRSGSGGLPLKGGGAPSSSASASGQLGGSRYVCCPICGVHVAILLAQQHAQNHFDGDYFRRDAGMWGIYGLGRWG